MYLVLILLQPYQPPTTPTHSHSRDHDPDHKSHDAALVRKIPDAFPVAAAAQDEAHASAGTEDEEDRESDVAAPGALARVPPEHGEEPEDLDGEEGEGEDLSRCGKAACEHGGGHQRGVRAKARGNVLIGGVEGGSWCWSAVVEEEDVDGEEEEGDGPDTVAGGRPGEGFEDGREAQEGEVDEKGGFGG